MKLFMFSLMHLNFNNIYLNFLLWVHANCKIEDERLFWLKTTKSKQLWNTYQLLYSMNTFNCQWTILYRVKNIPCEIEALCHCVLRESPVVQASIFSIDLYFFPILLNYQEMDFNIQNALFIMYYVKIESAGKLHVPSISL